MRSTQSANWLLLFLLAAIWGSSFILIKKGLLGLPPVQLACLRISLAALALLPWAIFHIKRVPSKSWWPIILVGLFGSGIPPFMFAFAQTHVPSALTGIINATVPLFAFTIGIAFFGVAFHWLKGLGVLSGLAGSAMLIFYGTPDVSLEFIQYGLLILVATICYGTSVNIIGKYLKEVHPLTITSVSFLAIGVPAIAYLLTTDLISQLSQSAQTRESFGFIAILAVVGTAFANFLFFNLTQRTTALFASTVTYLIPIVALFWGLGDGEPIGPLHVVGMILILAGVYLSSNRALKLMQRLSQRSQRSHP